MNETTNTKNGSSQTEQKRKVGGEIKIKRDTLKKIIIGLVCLAVIILVFGLGVFVGAMKAKFSYRWAENYHRNFGGPKEGFMRDWRMPPPINEFIEGHGTVGEIIKINGSELVIRGRDNLEKIVLIKDNTLINFGRQRIKKEELKVGDEIVVIGFPNEAGQIEAKLIRIFRGQGAEIFPKFPFRPFI